MPDSLRWLARRLCQQRALRVVSFVVAGALVRCWRALVLAGCGTLPPDRARPTSVALPLNDDSPLVEIAKARRRRARTSPASGCCRWRPMRWTHGCSWRSGRDHAWTCSTTCSRTTPPAGCCCARCATPPSRGVRVRLLVDDLYTVHTDAMLRGAGRAPERRGAAVQPLLLRRAARRFGRFAASLGDFCRVNHRMHNKLLHRRRRDGGGRRAQHRRRVLHARQEQQLRRHGRLRHGRGRDGSCRPSSTSTGTATWSIRCRRSCSRVRRRAGAPPSVDDGSSGRARRRPSCRRWTRWATDRSSEDLTAGRVGLIWGIGPRLRRPAEQARLR